MKSLTLLVGQYGVGGMSDAFLMPKSQGFLAAPINGVSKLEWVIRKNRDSASRATDRDVELLAVDQLRRELRVDIDNNLVNGRALCGVRGRGVPVVNMTEASGRSAQLSATVEPHNRTYRINGFERRGFAVGDAERPVGRAELYAVASCEYPMFLAEDLDAEQPDRTVFDAPSTARIDGKHIGVSIDCLDTPITSFGNGELFASARETNHITFFII